MFEQKVSRSKKAYILFFITSTLTLIIPPPPVDGVFLKLLQIQILNIFIFFPLKSLK